LDQRLLADRKTVRDAVDFYLSKICLKQEQYANVYPAWQASVLKLIAVINNP
jgi:hypothetical protein